MQRRTIAKVIYAAEHDMGPLKIRQPLPSHGLRYLDPFVLLHHAPPRLMDGSHGVDAHPHKGFAPVSFIFKGAIRHRDSRGHDSTVSAGGTQWMHAGSGILHEEVPLAGELELIQLWINSPASHKGDVPSYYPLAAADTPVVRSDDGLIRLNIIAGTLLDAEGPIPSPTPVNAATIEARRGGQLFIPLPATHNAFIYLLDGALRFGDGTRGSGFHQAVFNTDGDGVLITAEEDTRALLMSGEPIDEPVVSSGPFVMNTDEEIRAAYREYRTGAMGSLA
jgi:quercetin 2,3-dioxygenase